MVVIELKCSMCGCRLEAEALDREDPKERHIQGAPVRCPNCQSTMVNKIRVVRRVTLRTS